MSKVLKSIKYKGVYYYAGEKIDILGEDAERLAEKGFIDYVPEKKLSINSSVDKKEVKENNYDNVTIAEIKKRLDSKGIEYKSNSRKDELVVLLEGANNEG